MPLNDDDIVYSVVGMLPIDPDGPGFCTPLFRNDAGEKYFLQSLNRRKHIESFVFVGERQGAAILPYRHNGQFVVGNPPYVAFRMPDGSIIFDIRKRVHEHVIREIDRLGEYPFLYFQIARLSRSTELVRQAMVHDDVAEAISKGWLKLRVSEPKFAWSRSMVRRLRSLVARGVSTTAIAKDLGTSRNAVLSKMKRENLLQPTLDDNNDLFGSVPAEPLKPSSRPSMGPMKIEGTFKGGKGYSSQPIPGPSRGPPPPTPPKRPR